MVGFCQICCRRHDAWHDARVAKILKKGDPAACENYRPICLLSVGYKLFATILLERLRTAGCENKVWPTQFGFMRNRGKSDALFLARRIIDDAWAKKNGKAILVALDWAKAFDSVSPAALTNALLRFGIPAPYVDMIQAIYTGRRFIVRDAGRTSAWHSQYFGICQGCPLSLFFSS